MEKINDNVIWVRVKDSESGIEGLACLENSIVGTTTSENTIQSDNLVCFEIKVNGVSVKIEKAILLKLPNYLESVDVIDLQKIRRL